MRWSGLVWTSEGSESQGCALINYSVGHWSCFSIWASSPAGRKVEKLLEGLTEGSALLYTVHRGAALS